MPEVLRDEAAPAILTGQAAISLKELQLGVVYALNGRQSLIAETNFKTDLTHSQIGDLRPPSEALGLSAPASGG